MCSPPDYYSTDYKTNVPGTSVQNSLEAFMRLNRITEFKRYATTPDEDNPDQGTNEYIAYSPKRNASGAIYDASVMPLGAQVNGDFVLSKITYRSYGGYSETFYVVYKVMPDYIVSFSGSTENYTISTDEEGDGVISNVNKPFDVYSITNDGSQNNYSPFTLTSTDSTKGELSIKHEFGNNTSTEYSTTNFDITLTFNRTISGRAINNKDNFDQKFKYDGSSNMNNWREITSNGTTTGYEYKNAEGGRQTFAITFSAVKEVIFGNQYYMIEGEDVYGYKYQFYFCLKSQYTQPSIASTGQNPILKELGYFDIGSVYTMLNIEYSAGSGENNPGRYAIKTNNVSPVSSTEVPLINIANVGTYFFDRDYTTSTTGTESGPTNNKYLDLVDHSEEGSDPNAIYEPITGDNPRTEETETEEDGYDETSMWPTPTRKYFNSPNFKYVTVDSATFYSINEEDDTAGKELGTADMPVTSGSNEYNLATTTTQNAFFNGLEDKIREPFISGTFENESGIEVRQAIQVPAFAGEVYANSTETDMILVIRLKYLYEKFKSLKKIK